MDDHSTAYLGSTFLLATLTISSFSSCERISICCGLEKVTSPFLKYGAMDISVFLGVFGASVLVSGSVTGDCPGVDAGGSDGLFNLHPISKRVANIASRIENFFIGLLC